MKVKKLPSAVVPKIAKTKEEDYVLNIPAALRFLENIGKTNHPYYAYLKQQQTACINKELRNNKEVKVQDESST